MASMIPVSVAMATYNGQEHLRRQLDSLAAQSQFPAELVVTDDASEDDTIATIEAFAKTSPFPVYIHRNENRLGYRSNFMRAANLCRSELIAFCDQDDYWYPDKIKLSVKPFSDREVLLAFHNADVVTLDGKRVGSLATFAAQKPVLTPLSAIPWLTRAWIYHGVSSIATCSCQTCGLIRETSMIAANRVLTISGCSYWLLSLARLPTWTTL